MDNITPLSIAAGDTWLRVAILFIFKLFTNLYFHTTNEDQKSLNYNSMTHKQNNLAKELLWSYQMCNPEYQNLVNIYPGDMLCIKRTLCNFV